MESSTVLKPGDLIFVQGHLLHIVDDIIKLGEHIETHQPFATCYSHVAIFMGNGQVAEAQFGRKTGYTPLSAYEGNYDIGRVDLTNEQREKIVQSAIAEFGKRYDYDLIFGLGFDILTGAALSHDDANRKICSTYVNDVFKACGIRLVNTDTPTPEDLALSPKVVIERVVSVNE